MYTTKLDYSKLTEEQIRKAERLAREIEGNSKSKNNRKLGEVPTMYSGEAVRRLGSLTCVCACLCAFGLSLSAAVGSTRIVTMMRSRRSLLRPRQRITLPRSRHWVAEATPLQRQSQKSLRARSHHSSQLRLIRRCCRWGLTPQ